MRKKHVFLCSVLSVATVTAQQPAPLGAKVGVQTGAPATGVQAGSPVAPAVSAAPTAAAVQPAGTGASLVPVAVETPAPIPAPGSTPAAIPATPTPTPTPLEVPAPIEPPVAPVNMVIPEPPSVPPGNAGQPMPGIPSTVLPPTIPAAPSVPSVILPPGTEVPGSVPGQPGVSAATAAAMLNSSPSSGVHDFQNEDIAQILRLLARQAKINVVVSDQITGMITMRLDSMTPLEAIKVIVDAKGLTMEQRNNVYFVKTLAEKQKEPTESGNFTFSYAQAEKILPLLTTQIQCGVPPQFDQRTNTVYFREFKSNLENIRLFLESVDRPTQQVMIEARLVEVNANPRQSYGINWAGTFGGQKITYGGSTLGSSSLGSSTHTDPTTGLPVQVEQVSSLPTISNATNGTTQLQDFVLGGTGKNALNTLSGQFAILTVPQMSATWTLLNQDEDTEFLANPRIVTANNLKADIKITKLEPVPQLNFNEQTAQAVFGGFQDKEYGSTLTVTPTINKENFVTLLVKPEISSKYGDATFTFGGANVTSPKISKRTLESTVVIRSGDTLAIGGLLDVSVGKKRTKVPILGDIPVLGYAFQDRANEQIKRNLLIFVTPTVIEQGYGTGLEDQVSGLKHSGEEFADPNGWRNNAKGAVRIVPTSNRSIAADIPKPGVAPAPHKKGWRRKAVGLAPATAKATPTPTPAPAEKPAAAPAAPAAPEAARTK